MTPRKWRRAHAELCWHDRLLGVWCVECGAFVPMTGDTSACDSCGTQYRVRIESRGPEAADVPSH